MKVEQLVASIEDWVPMQFQYSWDNSGLQVGSLDWPVGKVLLTLDITSQVVQYAADHNFDFIFSHHPLIFDKLSQVDTSTSVGKVIATALRHDISIYSAHTNLDVVHHGVSDALAQLLGLKQTEILAPAAHPYEEMADDLPMPMDANYGLGRIGLVPHTTNLAQLASQVEKKLGCEGVRVCGDPSTSINTVAVCGGSGGDLVSLAQGKGADVLVTGDIGHHSALEALELGLTLLDPGHYATEAPVLKVVSYYINEHHSDVVTEIYPGTTDPFWFKLTKGGK